MGTEVSAPDASLPISRPIPLRLPKGSSSDVCSSMETEEAGLFEPIVEDPHSPRINAKLVAIDSATRDEVILQQEESLRQALKDDSESKISFLGLCEEQPCNAGIVACRFLGLLDLHMQGAVSASQDEPYSDITIGRGPDWCSWG